MRGDDGRQSAVSSYVGQEQRIPQGHPLRVVHPLVDEALNARSPEFSKLYAKLSRPSIAPERLLRAKTFAVGDC